MIERVRGRIRRLTGRGKALGVCPVCGKEVTPRQAPVKAWAGTYAHGTCASFAHRSRRERDRSQRVHERFTTP
jgi:hypothetical protein